MKIIKYEDIISSVPSEVTQNELVEKNPSDNDDDSDTDVDIQKNVNLRGRPKSGRIWKQPKKRFSSIIKTRGIRMSKEKKDLLRTQLKHVKEHSLAIKEEKKKEKEEKRLRRQDNLKRQEENRKKSEIVQVIKNPAKIKRMKKKQLRHIEKRDTSGMTN